MRSKNYIFILLLVVSITFVSAIEIDTSIKVNTVPNSTVNLAIKDSSGYWHHIKKDSGNDGSTLISFSIESSSYTMTLNLIKDNETVYQKRFEEEYLTGEFQEIDFYPKWYTPPKPDNETLVENITTENSTIQTNESTNEINPTEEKPEGKVTAFSVSNGEIKLSSRVLLYALGIIIIIVFIILFISWERKKPKKEKKIKVTKLSEINKINDDEIKKQEERIDNAKKELQQAQEELKKLRNPSLSKIEQAKNKLIEDQKELIRLREESKSQENKE